MVESDPFVELVSEFKRLWLEACRERLERLKAAWEPWIRRMLTEPIPDDWEAEVDDFVETVRNSIGLIIKPHSVAQIAALIRDRAGGTGVFAPVGPAPRQEPDLAAAAKPYLRRGYEAAPPEDILAGFTSAARRYAMPPATRARIITVANPKPGKGKPAAPTAKSEASFPLFKDPQTGKSYEQIIDATGTRYGDEVAANLAAGVNHKKLPGQPTWHHADFDRATGKMKMQLVLKAEHGAEGHTGGFAKFLDWAADVLNGGELRKLTATQAQALANALHSTDTMRQLAGRLTKLGITTAMYGGSLILKKGNAIIGRTLTREIAGKTIRMIASASAVFFVISAAVEVKAAGGDDFQAVQAAMREMIPADLIEIGFQFAVVAGAEVVAGQVSPPPGSSAADRRIISNLPLPAERRAAIEKLRKRVTMMDALEWANMKSSIAEQAREASAEFGKIGK